MFVAWSVTELSVSHLRLYHMSCCITARVWAMCKQNGVMSRMQPAVGCLPRRCQAVESGVHVCAAVWQLYASCQRVGGICVCCVRACLGGGVAWLCCLGVVVRWETTAVWLNQLSRCVSVRKLRRCLPVRLSRYHTRSAPTHRARLK